MPIATSCAEANNISQFDSKIVLQPTSHSAVADAVLLANET